MINKLERATQYLAVACEGNPVATTIVIMLFYVMFNFLEAAIEIALFGQQFHHWLDIFFTLTGIAYSAYAVYWCAIINTKKTRSCGAQDEMAKNEGGAA